MEKKDVLPVNNLKRAGRLSILVTFLISFSLFFPKSYGYSKNYVEQYIIAAIILTVALTIAIYCLTLIIGNIRRSGWNIWEIGGLLVHTLLVLASIALLGAATNALYEQVSKENTQGLLTPNKNVVPQRDKIRYSGELLIFNVLDLQVSRGVKQTFYMGLSNTDQNAKCFTVMFKCIKALTEGNSCDAVAGDNVWVGGERDTGITGETITEVANPWVKVFTLVNIDSGSVGEYPVIIQIGSATQDTYLMEVLEYKSDTGDCDNSPTWSGVAFQRNQFYIKVK
ncbi:MAG: hypothetical protein ABIF10_01635 [Candidatus Woesearchaeota archaeon]